MRSRSLRSWAFKLPSLKRQKEEPTSPGEKTPRLINGGGTPPKSPETSQLRTFGDFLTCYHHFIGPLKAANPKRKRIDKFESGSHGHVAVQFKYGGSLWGINFDSQIETLSKFYEEFRRGEDPFVLVEEEGKIRKLKPIQRLGELPGCNIYSPPMSPNRRKTCPKCK